ncbi:FAD-binding oxidoreductase [Candidatus Lokiarchaeum ossiferum]|uniref:FAD-binding oxidoreductase n=1 Tax=Candidatus Lokiarchaeum ossiferum TaxID=2951803 RepID=UPI00352DB0A1
MEEKGDLKVNFDHDPHAVIQDLDIVISKLKKILGNQWVSTDYIDKVAYGKDYWLISNQMTLDGKIPAYPDIIVWPQKTHQIAEILKYANSHKPPIPVIPYGEGSGVVGGAVPIKGGIMVDMKHFDQITINAENMTATIGTGVNGKVLERYMHEHGFRMGHIPQSLHASTVGGYVAHRAAGQFSGKYGKMEDIVKSLEVVLPTGEIVKSKFYPRASVGPIVDRIFLGSEGTLGIVTEVTCRIWPFPEKQAGSSFVFPTLQDSLNAIRETLQANINPAVVRIYDKPETVRHFGSTEKKSKDKLMVIFVFEGSSRLVDLEMTITEENCLKHNGEACGSRPVDHWFETRFNVKESSDFGPYGLVFDTVEVSIPWDKANELYEAVVQEILAVPGALMATGHASHFYPTGVCFYFTFSGVPKKNQDYLELYNQCWDAAVRGTLLKGGAASHHHGMGLNRTRWMQLEHGEEFILLKRIKKLLDPNNIMNPGKLFSQREEGSVYLTQRSSLDAKPKGGL